MKKLVEVIYRTGIQSVLVDEGRYYLTLKNRSNDTRIEVEREVAMRYYRKMVDDLFHGREGARARV